VTVDGVAKDGKPRHSLWVGKFDGKAYPMKGKNMPVDSIAYKMVNDRTNEITAMKNVITDITLNSSAWRMKGMSFVMRKNSMLPTVFCYS